MIENFRFSSSWEEFEEAVRILKDLLKRNKAHWLIGYLREFDIYIDEDEKERLEEDVLEIIHSEILYLLYEVLRKNGINAEKMKEAILKVRDGVSEDSVQEAITSVRNKLEFVKDSFDIVKLRQRYALKKDSVSSKLSGFHYNIYTSNLSGEDNANCAFINISVKKRLTGMHNELTLLVNAERQDEVCFMCDQEDLNMLIHQLEMIKTKMEEY